MSTAALPGPDGNNTQQINSNLEVSGLPEYQTGTPSATFAPFAGAILTDANPPGYIDSVSISVNEGTQSYPDQLGHLSGTGVTALGTAGQGYTQGYTVTAANLAALQADLRGVIYVPPNTGADSNQFGATVALSSTAPALAGAGKESTAITYDPTGGTSGTKFPPPTTVSGIPVSQTDAGAGPLDLFSGAILGGTNSSGTNVVTVRLTDSLGRLSDAVGVLTGAGISQDSPGQYTINGATTADLQANVRRAAFAPPPNVSSETLSAQLTMVPSGGAAILQPPGSETTVVTVTPPTGTPPTGTPPTGTPPTGTPPTGTPPIVDTTANPPTSGPPASTTAASTTSTTIAAPPGPPVPAPPDDGNLPTPLSVPEQQQSDNFTQISVVLGSDSMAFSDLSHVGNDLASYGNAVNANQDTTAFANQIFTDIKKVYSDIAQNGGDILTRVPPVFINTLNVDSILAVQTHAPPQACIDFGGSINALFVSMQNTLVAH